MKGGKGGKKIEKGIKKAGSDKQQEAQQVGTVSSVILITF